jgi:hypothetical protein
MILNHLGMIEAVLGAGSGRPHTLPARSLDRPERGTLRELFRFFTSRVGVHFKREAVLIRAVGRTLGRGREAHDQFDHLLAEHRVLKADASRILMKLKAGGVSRPSADPYGIRAFVTHYRGHLACEERILYVLAGTRLSVEHKHRVACRMLQV